jgi:nucleotide-binding universal stress UspA family protein
MEGTQMSKKYLVAVDGSDHGWKALNLATDLAAVSDAELIILHVVPYGPLPEGLQQYSKIEGVPIEDLKAQFHYSRAIGDNITSEAEARARKNGLTRVTTKVAEGSPANEIVALAEAEGADMVFLGSRGFGDIGGLLMGSVSHKVMHLAPCTCVTVK